MDTEDQVPKGRKAAATKALEEQAKAEQQRRLTVAAINESLSRLRCENCTTVGMWEIYGQERTLGRVRYVRCRACGHPQRLAIILKENDREAEKTA